MFRFETSWFLKIFAKIQIPEISPCRKRKNILCYRPSVLVCGLFSFSGKVALRSCVHFTRFLCSTFSDEGWGGGGKWAQGGNYPQKLPLGPRGIKVNLPLFSDYMKSFWVLLRLGLLADILFVHLWYIKIHEKLWNWFLKLIIKVSPM